MLTEASANNHENGIALTVLRSEFGAPPGKAKVVTYFAYVLYSASTDTFYKGSTANLQKRIYRHNTGEGKFTRSRISWTLLWSAEKPTRIEALRLERKLKNLTRSRLVEFMRRYKDGIAGPCALSLIEQIQGTY